MKNGDISPISNLWWHLEAAHFGLCCRRHGRHADWHRHRHHRHLAGALDLLAEKNLRLDHTWSQYMDDTYIIHTYIYITRKSSIISSHINWVHSSIHVAPIGVVNRDVAPGNTCGPACCGIPWGKLVANKKPGFSRKMFCKWRLLHFSTSFCMF